MSRIAILTDSGAFLTSEMVTSHDVSVIPLKINWNGESYLDGVEITPSAFYERLARDPGIPTTSQITTLEFLEMYKKLAQDHDGIIAVLISSGISGTIDSARAAMEQFSKVPVAVVDTHSAASGEALIVLAAIRAAESGKSLAEIVRITEEVASDLRVYFVVDTLKYLHRGGRINTASRFLGSALNIKPLLYMDAGGKIEALERVRTHHKALERLVELSVEKAGNEPAYVGILHANDRAAAEYLQDDLKRRIDCKEIHIFELSPVIGSHVGPGTVGVAVHRAPD